MKALSEHEKRGPSLLKRQKKRFLEKKDSQTNKKRLKNLSEGHEILAKVFLAKKIACSPPLGAGS